MSLVTFTMDEEGLAKALFDKSITDSALVYKVFERLRVHYFTDAGDVALRYTVKVREEGGQVEMALKGEPQLLLLLNNLLVTDDTVMSQSLPDLYLAIYTLFKEGLGLSS